eukprot:2534202-Prymnesium_polylepis.2
MTWESGRSCTSEDFGLGILEDFHAHTPIAAANSATRMKRPLCTTEWTGPPSTRSSASFSGSPPECESLPPLEQQPQQL